MKGTRVSNAVAIDEVKRSSRNLTEEAYHWIRSGILTGALPFGARLSRRAIAEQLGISIVPVGDALQRLETDGLVESRPRVGTRVRIPTGKAIRGHFILREALETQSARIFAEQATADERDEISTLAKNLDDMYASAGQETETAAERMFEIHKVHMDFHMRVAECTRCDELYQAIEKNQVLVFNWLYDTALGNLAPPPQWHSQLASALVSGDAEVADAAMRRHTRYRMEDLLQRMEPSTGWGKPPGVDFSEMLARHAEEASLSSISGAEIGEGKMPRRWRSWNSST
jgi:DNA-binding GntR family transcriptional regulator